MLTLLTPQPYARRCRACCIACRDCTSSRPTSSPHTRYRASARQAARGAESSRSCRLVASPARETVRSRPWSAQMCSLTLRGKLRGLRSLKRAVRACTRCRCVLCTRGGPSCLNEPRVAFARILGSKSLRSPPLRTPLIKCSPHQIDVPCAAAEKRNAGGQFGPRSSGRSRVPVFRTLYVV